MIAELFIVTAYGASVACGGAGTGVTKTGARPLAGWTVAADPRVLPIGSVIHVEGVGVRYVEDIGSAIKGRRLDLYTDDLAAADRRTCDEARQWGVQKRRVRVLLAASDAPSSGRGSSPRVSRATARANVTQLVPTPSNAGGASEAAISTGRPGVGELSEGPPGSRSVANSGRPVEAAGLIREGDAHAVATRPGRRDGGTETTPAPPPRADSQPTLAEIRKAALFALAWALLLGLLPMAATLDRKKVRA